MKEKSLSIGLDFGKKYALVSYCTSDMSEPDTISTVAGSELYQIPLSLCKRRGIGQWYYGKEAETVMKNGEGSGCDRLFSRTLAGEQVTVEGETYDTVELLSLFVRKIFTVPQKFGTSMKLARITITMDTLNREKMELIEKIAGRMKWTKEQYHVIDYAESFYYYALSQKEELWLHDAVLFDYSKNSMRFYYMERNLNSTPQLVHIYLKDYGPLIGNKDTAFLDVVTDAISRKIYSSVYLTGDGFDGEWMRESLKFLCNGRHVFLGKNLYAKGACYASCIHTGMQPWQFVYIGENEMKVNISLKVKDREELIFHTLVSAGENWYEAKNQCEILLAGTNTIDFWLQLPDSREAKIESLELTDIPKRPERMTRLSVMTEALSDSAVKVTIRDLGFGEIYKSSEKVWEYKMEL